MDDGWKLGWNYGIKRWQQWKSLESAMKTPQEKAATSPKVCISQQPPIYSAADTEARLTSLWAPSEGLEPSVSLKRVWIRFYRFCLICLKVSVQQTNV